MFCLTPVCLCETSIIISFNLADVRKRLIIFIVLLSKCNIVFSFSLPKKWLAWYVFCFIPLLILHLVISFFSFLDEPKVTLSEKCGGEVKINNINVCSTYWNDTYSHLVCKEQGCDKAIATINSTSDQKRTDYYHVTCEDYHHKLGQCSNFKAECKDNLVSVYCIGKYVCAVYIHLYSSIPAVTLTEEMSFMY